MLEVRDLVLYRVLHNHYTQEYYVVCKLFDSLEHQCRSLSEALSMAQAWDGAMGSFIVEETE